GARGTGRLRPQRAAGIRSVASGRRGATAISPYGDGAASRPNRILQRLQPAELRQPQQQPDEPAVRVLDANAREQFRIGRSERRLQSPLPDWRSTLDSTGAQA